MAPARTHDNMSGSLAFPRARYARNSKLVAYLTVAYLLLVGYASLYPFSDWRIPSYEAARFLFAGWPPYIGASDVVVNVLAYFPLGLLLTLLWMGYLPRLRAMALGVGIATLLSFAIEFAQAYVPTRIPSNVDVLTNSIGGLWGATAAYAWGERWLLSGELHRLRERHFEAGARTDLAFLLLFLWLLTQFNADSLLFGNGSLRHFVPLNFGWHYSAEAYLLLEASVTAVNLVGVACLVGTVARSFAATAVAVTVVMLTALALKTIAAMALFVPGNPGAWLTPGSALGLVAGLTVWPLLSRSTPVQLMRASAFCFAAGVVLVNLAPENPYLIAALRVLQRGHLLPLNAMIGLVSSWWPALVLVYCVFWLRTGAAVRKTGPGDVAHAKENTL
jgi:VanZ family protein